MTLYSHQHQRQDNQNLHPPYQQKSDVSQVIAYAGAVG